MSRTVVKDKSGRYMIIEPGDGTRYTVMTCLHPDSDPDNIYIAIGAGNEIVGGYFMRKSSLIPLARRLAGIDEGQEMTSFLMNDHYIQYWLAHFKGHDWTGVVAVLIGMVMVLSNEQLYLSLEIIGNIYHSDHDEVYGDLLHWLNEYDKENKNG